MSVWEEIRYFIVSSYFSKIFVNYIGKTLSLLWRSSVDTLAKWSPATNHIEMNVSLWMRGTQYHFWKFSSVTPCHSVQWLFVIPSTAACQASLSITNSRSLLKFMSIELVMPSKHLVLCHPLLLLPSIFPSIRLFSSESVLRIRWPKYWSFSFSISPSNEYSGLISFRID